MTSGDILLHSTTAALAILIAAMLLAVVRLLRGPALPDRILALDTLNTLGIGLIAVVAIRTGVGLYLDIAIALGLVGFLSTVALARYVLQRAGRSAPES
jgi:multicomponent Na+:H+ antiporter subunit F